MSEYAETGYEGHGGTSLYDLADEDIAAFGDLVARSVGGVPESIGMRYNRKLTEILNSAVSGAKNATEQLIDETWPAQAVYLLTRPIEKIDKLSIADVASDPKRTDEAVGYYCELEGATVVSA